MTSDSNGSNSKKANLFFVVLVFAQAFFAAPKQKSVVYFSHNITGKSLIKVFDAAS